jgi:hypothetical protein
VGLSLRWGAGHPELAFRWDALLRSINDRLGGKPGEDVEPLSTRWLGDLERLDEGDDNAELRELLRQLQMRHQ